jgi:hypothetical protein
MVAAASAQAPTRPAIAAVRSVSRHDAAIPVVLHPASAQTALAAAIPALPSYEVQDYDSRYVYQHFLSILDDPSSFHRKLWRRVSHNLVPLYTAAGKTITQEVSDDDINLVLDLLDHIGYDTQLEQFDYRILLQKSLENDNEAYWRTRRLMQLVEVMVMLAPIIPMGMDIIIGCFKFVLDLYDRISFQLIESAISNPTIANAPTLKVITMLLVDASLEQICLNLGPQWGLPGDRFFVAAEHVKIKLERGPQAT